MVKVNFSQFEKNGQIRRFVFIDNVRYELSVDGGFSLLGSPQRIEKILSDLEE